VSFVVIDMNKNNMLLIVFLFSVSLITFPVQAEPITATGGTVTLSGGKTIHTFTSSGTFNVVSGTGTVEYLVVGGGGGAGYEGGMVASGGGGAGGFRSGTLSVNTQSYTIVVGAGGGADTNGQDSTFDTITALGGGAGGGDDPGNSGGSGGGGYGSGSQAGGTGTAGQGNNGGKGEALGTATAAGGGGGGAGEVGGDAIGDIGTGFGKGGDGGDGLQLAISGTPTYYAGGGSGGDSLQSPETGGLGGGGDGRISGTPNTGGGGGARGGAGGSGIVIISYTTSQAAGITVCSSGCDSTTINGALTQASNGDEIRIIDSRTYNEALIIDKSITLTSISFPKPVITSSASSPTMSITSDDVIVSNLEIEYTGRVDGIDVIRISPSNNVSFSGNVIKNTGAGGWGRGISISYREASFTSMEIKNNTIIKSGGQGGSGIELGYVFDSIVTGNIISIANDTSPYSNIGISMTYGASRNILSYNTISISTNSTRNYNSGMYIGYGGYNLILGNTITTDGGKYNIGIELDSVINITIQSNSITTNGSSRDNPGIVVVEDEYIKSLNIIGNNISTGGVSENYGIFLELAGGGGRTFEGDTITILSNNISTGGTGKDNIGLVLNSGPSFFQRHFVNISSNVITTSVVIVFPSIKLYPPYPIYIPEL